MTARRHGTVASLFLAACLPAGAGSSGPSTPADDLPPVGFGTLRQEEISIRLQTGDLQLRITPLAEAVTRLTAPDTYRRLSGIAARAVGADDGRLPVLVSIYTGATGGSGYEPRDLRLENRGRTFRPLSIQSLSSGWGSGRLAQNATEQAVYLFAADVDLEMELRVRFGEGISGEWATVRARLEAERERVRARAGGGALQSSSSNFLILR